MSTIAIARLMKEPEQLPPEEKPSCGNGVSPQASADDMRAKLAALDGDLPIPAFLLRTNRVLPTKDDGR
jgi:hypothetical protein